jgi:hypothetical protein
MAESRRRPLGVWIHGVVVAVFVGFFLVVNALPYDGIGANIGAGLTLLPVLVLGLPWTAPVFAGAIHPPPGPLWYLVMVGPAVFNVALHAAVVGWRRRRTA